MTGAMGWFMASDYWIARMDEDATDIRWGIMDYDESSATRFGSCMKYVGGAAMQGDKASRSAVNVKVTRLSEMYLVAAEAALRLPTLTGSRPQDTSTRSGRGLPVLHLQLMPR
ncbi:MAG: hypothetical protein R2758_07935 [Bacteroidales bacterium]